VGGQALVEEGEGGQAAFDFSLPPFGVRWGCPSGAGCSKLGTNSFRPPPHHPASPCTGAVPHGLDAQATELGTCLWALGPLGTSLHFSPWQLWPILVGVFRSFQ
jgi:hypothetical protein